MATLKEIKDRKASIKSINKITTALKLVSTAKAQKNLKALNQFKPFYLTLNKILFSLSKEVSQHLKSDDSNKTLWIVFTSDLGLAGGFNSLLIKEFINQINLNNDEVIVFGNKGKQLLTSRLGSDKIKHFTFFTSESFLAKLGDNNDIVDQLEAKVTNKFKIKVIYNKYVNQITTNITIKQVLPLDLTENDLEPTEEFTKENGLEINPQIIFEPSAHGIMPQIIEFYLAASLNYFYRNSLASEESSRRNAMENASTNSEEMIKELSKQFNRVRQSKITQEIAELLSGS